jgi:hypothetical protein
MIGCPVAPPNSLTAGQSASKEVCFGAFAIRFLNLTQRTHLSFVFSHRSPICFPIHVVLLQRLCNSLQRAITDSLPHPSTDPSSFDCPSPSSNYFLKPPCGTSQLHSRKPFSSIASGLTAPHRRHLQFVCLASRQEPASGHIELLA